VALPDPANAEALADWRADLGKIMTTLRDRYRTAPVITSVSMSADRQVDG
jgi:hypothetical protein